MFAIRFKSPASPVCCGADGQIAFRVTPADGTLVLEAFYDVHEDPLTLTANAVPGDEILFVCRDYRLEVFVNGALCEEEWPYGNPLFHCDMLCRALDAVPFEPQPAPEPSSVLGSFKNAEGWYPGGGVFVGDCMPYYDEGRYHVLYLKDRHHHHSKWRLGAHQWAHISTADFETWDIHPMAVEIDDPMEGSICTGSWMRAGSTHYLYYTVRMSDRSPAIIARSVSSDGYHYKKDKSFGFTLSDRWHRVSARDPKIVKSDDGWHMFVTTSQMASGKGALAHLLSTDGDTWQELDAIYVANDSDQPECSDHFFFKGHYYLVFSHRGSAHYRISEKPFSDWQTPEGDPLIPCSSVPKAAIFDGRLIFTGFRRIDGYAGSMTFMEADAAPDGTLIFENQ